jgi:hypothetical protein
VKENPLLLLLIVLVVAGIGAAAFHRAQEGRWSCHDQVTGTRIPCPIKPIPTGR